MRPRSCSVSRRALPERAVGTKTTVSEPSSDAYSGRLLQIKQLLVQKKTDDALIEALRWWAAEPGDVLALVALARL